MEIIIHTPTKKFFPDYKKALDEYTKRTLPFSKVSLKAYKIKQEIKTKSSSFTFLVCSGKDTISSSDLAAKIQELNINGFSCIEFLICKAEDLDFYRQKIIHSIPLNLTSFNMDYQLTSVVLMEQIYRAYTILNNITYHK